MKRSLFALSCFPFAVCAVNLPVRQTKRDSFGVVQPGTSNVTSTGQITNLSDVQDLVYMANVTVAGQQFTVQLDSGSSDLWIATPTVLGNQSNLNVNLTYGIGYAAGPIASAPVSFAGFNVPAQAYVAAQEVNNPITGSGAQGLLGLGFTSLSNIDMAVNQTGDSWGRTLLYNVFAQNPSEPNFMTFSLQRVDDPNEDVQGSFTIGEYDPQYAGVANTSYIPTYPEKNPSRWGVLIDKIIANGQEVPLSSAEKGVPSGKAVGLLDTGTSRVFAPPNIVTAIYGNISGAQYSDSSAMWSVPCDAEVDVSLVIGGRLFDIHPLDAVQPLTTDGKTCGGSWLPQSLDVGTDLILGDAALRSIYTVFGFGNFDPNYKMSDPYFQLWSLVNGTEASAEFHRVRGGTSHDTFLPNENVNAAASSTGASSARSTADPNAEILDLQNKVNNLIKWAPVVLGVLGLNIVVLLILVITSFVGYARRRRNRRSGPTSFSPLPSASEHDYRPVLLQETPKYIPGARYSD